MMTGGASPYEIAMNGQSKTPVAFVSYSIIILGIIMATRSTHRMATWGFFVMACVGCLPVVLHRRYLRAAFMDYMKQSLGGDLANIANHYKLAGDFDETNGEQKGLGRIGKSAFWVAELDVDGAEPTIVGCIGLDAYSNPDETTAELRRVVVSPKHQRQGIAIQLVNAAVTHGKSQGIQSIFLTTSSYQPAAIKMYHKLGWELQNITEIPIPLGKIRVHKFHLDL